jgi:Domain of unknown function (DUF4349)
LPDLIAPERVEELLGGALPEGEREARLQGLVREVRAEAPAAPEALRERVLTRAATPPRRRVLRGNGLLVGRLPRRRLVLSIALPLVALAMIGSALVLRGGSASRGDESDAPAAADMAEAATEEGAQVAPSQTTPAADFELESKGDSPGRTLAGAGGDSALVPRGRAVDVDLWMELRLGDADELSAAAREAMKITRELGGWVAGSDVDTNGREGTAELELRVPVGRVEDAVVELADLGTVTGQRVETEDLQAGIDSRTRRIERLERSIRVLELRLESGTLEPEEELRVRLELERRRNEAADLRRANLGDRREAATSELTLLLHTREAEARQDEDEGGAAGAAGDALELLGKAGAVALYLAIVLSPILLLLVLLWLALRTRSRRVETQLLDRSDPAAPPSAPPV